MEKTIIVFLMLTTSQVENAKIFGSAMIPSYSHHLVFNNIWKELASRGHELIVLTPFPMKENIPNLTQIDVSSTENIWKQDFSNPPNTFKMFLRITETLEKISRVQLSHPGLKKLLEEKPKFDLVIVEHQWTTMFIFQAIFNCPMVGISTIGIPIAGDHAIGNPNHPILTPDYSLPISDEMNFFERIASTWFYLFMMVFHKYVLATQMDKTVRDSLGNGLPSVWDLQRNFSMIFVNTNPFINAPRPNVPQRIEFHGLTIKKNKTELPKAIKTFLDGAVEGAVYFSLGTNVRSALLPLSLRQQILDTISQLPYKFLWKYEDETLLNITHNVHISKWLPQQEILDHPNVKLFITQGGIQSLEETVYYEVPIVGMPFFADQPKNIKKMVQLGMGLSIDPKDFCKDRFKEIITEVIENPKFRNKVEEYSNIMKDQPSGSMDKLVWWIEYVIRHRGTAHLRTPYADIPWWKFLLLDVVGFSVVFGLGTAGIMGWCLRWTIGLCKKKVKTE